MTQRFFDRLIDSWIIVLLVRQQGADLPAAQCLQGCLHAVHRPATRHAILHRLRVRALPGALALLAQCQRRIADLGRRRLPGAELHHAEHEIVHIRVKVGDDGASVHTDAAQHDAAERLLAVELENAIGDLRVQPLLLRADPVVVVVFAGAARWRAPARHHQALVAPMKFADS